MRIPLRSTRAAYGKCGGAVDMTDENKEAQQDERGARRGEWYRSLKDGALGLISEGKKHSIRTVWCSLVRSGAVWRLKYR